MHEVEEEELLHESLLRDVRGDELVGDGDDDMLVFFVMSRMMEKKRKLKTKTMVACQTAKTD